MSDVNLLWLIFAVFSAAVGAVAMWWTLRDQPVRPGADVTDTDVDGSDLLGDDVIALVCGLPGTLAGPTGLHDQLSGADALDAAEEATARALLSTVHVHPSLLGRLSPQPRKETH